MRPITMQVNYTLINTAVPFGQLEPILDDYIPTTVTAQVRLTTSVLILSFCLIKYSFRGVQINN